MSNKMPNNAGTDPLPFNNFTRDKESDRIIRDLTFNEAAYITAARMARASPINADETELREQHMGSTVDRGFPPEKIPPIPQFPFRASHAASTLQITVLVGAMGACALDRPLLSWTCLTA
ncbi:hypothetical protein DY000_02037310 [Brassica cretica]|uniref:SMP domain-containing protein n=1 Tax=Brassica cretica TaxID=69181 RepID=A0ABQ7BFM3_BRACR|nr:hypothetical protein DY000_02037310 [Brassica cretica]